MMHWMTTEGLMCVGEVVALLCRRSIVGSRKTTYEILMCISGSKKKTERMRLTEIKRISCKLGQ